MNIFIIPSWYPSDDHPLVGIFFHEQALALASLYPEYKFALSLWGQNDEKMLLHANDPIGSAKKIFDSKPNGEIKWLAQNLEEYHCPTYTWTNKILQGNITNIIAANTENLNTFENKHGKAGLIHAHVGYPAGHIAKVLSAKNGIPYIITEHMGPFPHRYFRTNEGQLSRELKSAYQHSSKNIAVSEALKMDMEHFKISNLTCISNLISDDFFGNTNIQNKVFTFFSLGRLVPIKGMDLLLKAFAKINAPVRLRIGGDGSEMKTLKALTHQLGIVDKVYWLGELDRAATIIAYQKCDAYVLASRHESMGLTYAEAMASGKPVIGTRCGGPEDFVDDTVGALVPVDNVQALATAMEEITKKQYNSEVIMKKAEKLFSAKVVCGQIMETYQTAMHL